MIDSAGVTLLVDRALFADQLATQKLARRTVIK
jgi:hypothetical protein